jgi:hypothetical protein
MENNSFIFGFVAGAAAVIGVIVLIKQLSVCRTGGNLVELRRDYSGNIVEILEHGF